MNTATIAAVDTGTHHGPTLAEHAQHREAVHRAAIFRERYTVDELEDDAATCDAYARHSRRMGYRPEVAAHYERRAALARAEIARRAAPAAVDTGAQHGPSFTVLLRASLRDMHAAERRLVFDGNDWTPETEAPYREAQRRHYALCQHAPSPFTVDERAASLANLAELKDAWRTADAAARAARHPGQSTIEAAIRGCPLAAAALAAKDAHIAASDMHAARFTPRS